MASILVKWPMLRTMIPASLALGGGDALCQKLEGRETWNMERSSRMAITGFFLVSPLMYHISRGLDRVFPGMSSGPVAVKSLINSLCTVFYISGSFTGNAVLAGQGVQALVNKLDERLLGTWMMGVPYWCIGGAFTFRVALPMRGLVTSAIALSWNVFLSHQINRKSHSSHKRQQQQQQHLIRSLPRSTPMLAVSNRK